jgi:hypothetical protein
MHGSFLIHTVNFLNHGTEIYPQINPKEMKDSIMGSLGCPAEVSCPGASFPVHPYAYDSMTFVFHSAALNVLYNSDICASVVDGPEKSIHFLGLQGSGTSMPLRWSHLPVAILHIFSASRKSCKSRKSRGLSSKSVGHSLFAEMPEFPPINQLKVVCEATRSSRQ